MNQVILSEVIDNIGIITLNRPEKRNALSPELLIKLHLRLKEFEKSNNIRVLIIKGAGDRAFSSGYDILAIPNDFDEEEKEILKKHNPLELALNTLKNFPYPVIAMINGYVFGAGLNLAICCDIRIGVENIKAGMPPSRLGLVYHPDGIKQFIDVIGIQKTKEIFFTAKNYSGLEVKENKLVDWLVPEDKIEEFTFTFANEMAQNAPLSLKGTKRIINMITESNMNLNKDQLDEIEKLIVESLNSDDLKEGQKAFIEKRKPVFIGK